MTADRGGGPLNPVQGVPRLDILAGLTAAAVVVPKAMAYATIAGLPLQVGLYTAFVPMVVYALLGTSRPLSVSTTTTIAILTAAELGAVAPGGDAAELIAAGGDARGAGRRHAAAGVACCASASSRNFISDPVLTGFKSGIGLVIVVDQLPKLLGIHIEKSRLLPRPVRDRAAAARDVSLVTAGCSALALLALIFGARALRSARAGAAHRHRRGHRRIGAARADEAGVATVGAVPQAACRRSSGRSWISSGRCGRRRPASR